MQRPKIHLQKHRLKAFSKTLELVECSLQQRIDFITDYNEIYKFPAVLTKKNLRHYRRMLKATKELRNLQRNDL